MTTAGLPDTSTYTTRELVSCLVARSACAYGSEGWGFESLQARAAEARAAQRRFRSFGGASARRTSSITSTDVPVVTGIKGRPGSTAAVRQAGEGRARRVCRLFRLAREGRMR